MAYRHGVYTSEVSTSIQTAAPVDSALPFVIGTAPRQVGPVLITSWSRYCAAFGVSENVDINGPEFSRGGTLTNFAYYWFILAGRSDCILQSLPAMKYSSEPFQVKVGADVVEARFNVGVGLVSAANRDTARKAVESGSGRIVWDAGTSKYVASYGSEDVTAALTNDSYIAPITITLDDVNVTLSLVAVADNSAITAATLPDGVTELSFELHAYGEVAESIVPVTAAIQSIHTLYERFSRVASILLVPGAYFAPNFAGLAAVMASAVSNIGGRFKGVALVDLPAGDKLTDYSTVVSLESVHESKESTSPYLIYAWPNVGVGEFRFPASVALAAAINATDGQYGGLPYVSPSNKPLPVTGAYYVSENNEDGEIAEVPVFATRDDENTYLGAYGITGFRNTAQGWVAWGDNTAAFPGSTDVKDYMIPIRRMFNYVSNQFQIFADARVDMPLNLRQLEGVVKSFNQILAGWVGFGALNAGSVELDKELNTTASLLSGTVYIRIRIAPPPAMVVIEGVLEYDVQGFERSLA